MGACLEGWSLVYFTHPKEITEAQLSSEIDTAALPSWLGGTLRDEMRDKFATTESEILGDREKLKEALECRCRRCPPFGINFTT